MAHFDKQRSSLLPEWAERYIIIGLIGVVMTLADRRISEIERRLLAIEQQHIRLLQELKTCRPAGSS